MISALVSSNQYILQPSLLEMHRQSVDWLSAIELAKKEVFFFQKLLDKHAAKENTSEFKKQVDHFQNLITYYNGEVIDYLKKKILQHEQHLARMLRNLNEADIEYYREHGGVIEDLNAFQKTFNEFKHHFIEFIERGYSPYALS